MCSVCFVYCSGFNWNHGRWSIIIKFLIPLIYLCKHSCGHRRQWWRCQFQSIFLLVLKMWCVPTSSLGREKPRSWLRLDVWPCVSSPTWVNLGFCSCLPSWAPAWWWYPVINPFLVFAIRSILRSSVASHRRAAWSGTNQELLHFVVKTSWLCRLHTCSGWEEQVVTQHCE